MAAAVAAGRERLTAFMWTQPVRRRRALLLVGHHVLDRMERTNSRRVPVPERDLVEDTCLTDRKTIRTALRLLNGPLGLLDTETWDPARRADSSFEFEIPEAPDPGVREIPPPSSHTPLPRGTWSQLPGPSHALWRQLPDATGPPLTASQLAWRSGLTDFRDQAPTQSQLRSTQAALTALAAAGLAHCAADATWSRRSTITSDHAERSTARHAEISAIVAAERRRYRAAGASWQRARARALKQQISRERAWWHGLEATERVQRRTEWVRRFDQLPVQKQERLKARLATKRVRAGMDERARHAEWVASMDSDEFLERSVTRQQRFEGLAPPLQQAFAASWQRHRARFGID
ncbi:MAG TPA: hypothetical protein VLD58_16885, partial [Gemmatimonadales bacterium]|nr:hypothetical protein [Gemmatimonadales bacterium]